DRRGREGGGEAQRHDDQVHDDVGGEAVGDAPLDGAGGQRRPARGGEHVGGGHHGHQREVDGEAERGAGRAPFGRGRGGAGGDEAQHPGDRAAVIQGESGGKGDVERAGDEGGEGDGLGE